jgi:phage tail-like protein
VSAPTLSLAAILGLQNRFLVVIDGISLGGWGKCTGLKVDFTPFKMIEGGNYNNENILPGQVKYTDITLERAIEPAGSAIVQRWLSSRVSSWVNAPGSAHGAVAGALNAVGSMVGLGDIGGAAGSTGEITLCSAEGKPLISWSLRNVYPASWKGPDLDAATMGIAREQLVLCHEGFL